MLQYAVLIIYVFSQSGETNIHIRFLFGLFYLSFVICIESAHAYAAGVAFHDLKESR